MSPGDAASASPAKAHDGPISRALCQPPSFSSTLLLPGASTACSSASGHSSAKLYSVKSTDSSPADTRLPRESSSVRSLAAPAGVSAASVFLRLKPETCRPLNTHACQGHAGALPLMHPYTIKRPP
eukprot:GHUV01047064.1.p2 GENE.GHUV01047064.1~~GHUV01047064.1.p2  ORF type:complete len:126 (-),score=33.16 GHUV01047064.1:972-1349(-)